MRFQNAIFYVSFGLAICPDTVFSFSGPTSTSSLNTMSQAHGEATTKTRSITRADASIQEAPIPEPSASAPEPNPNSNFSIGIKSKQKWRKSKPNEDNKFLVKRSKQILQMSTKKKVNLSTIHWLLDAWAKSSHPAAADYSLSLLEEGTKLHKVMPTQKTFAKVIKVLGVAGKGGEECEKFVKDIMEEKYGLTSNVYTYTAILEAYTAEGTEEAVSKAEELLKMMENHETIKPNAHSYNVLICAYSNMQEAEKAEKCIEQMEEMYGKGLIDDAPSIFNYNSAISAWANSVDEGNALRAEALLKQMQENSKGADPDVVSYNAVIDAHAKNGDGEKAEMWLRTMMESSHNTDGNPLCQPNTKTYNTVIAAYAKSTESNAATQAEIILREMTKNSESTESTGAVPDLFSFATLMNAWGRSLEYGKAEKVFDLYKEMLKLYKEGNKKLRPNVVVYNSILNACAYTTGDLSEQQKAMAIANLIFQELHRSPYDKPDEISYGTFFKVCQNQIPPGKTRHDIVDVIFRKCVEDGQVGQLVLDQMKVAATSDQFKALVGVDADDAELLKLPQEWRRNVTNRNRSRRQ